jgi:hypothetical protein
VSSLFRAINALENAEHISRGHLHSETWRWSHVDGVFKIAIEKSSADILLVHRPAEFQRTMNDNAKNIGASSGHKYLQVIDAFNLVVAM